MATKTFYLLNTTATSPGWFGAMQEGGSAPAGALSAFGSTVAKIALTTPYWRARVGATARSTEVQAATRIEGTTGPTAGTGSGATTAGDSFRSPTPLSGLFVTGQWAFTFGMRTGAASNAGRMRYNIWASPNLDGSNARRLTLATSQGSIVTLSTTTTTYNSTLNYTVGTEGWGFNDEYLFVQCEWQSTTAGTSNSCTAQFYQSNIVTTDFVPAIADAWNVADKVTFTLSNSDKTATATSGSAAVRSTRRNANESAGKYYAEFYCDSPSANTRLGFSNTASSLANIAAATNLYADGSVYVNNSVVGTASAFSTGSVVCMAWDAGAEQVWFRVNNGLWNNSASADPATGVGGIDSSFTPAGNQALWFYTGNSGAAVTVRTELVDLTLQGPEGFTTWMGEVIPLPSIADAWNVNDKDASLTLSGNDKIVTSSVVGSQAIRSTSTIPLVSTEKYYAEYLQNNYVTDHAFGIKRTGNALNLINGGCAILSQMGNVLVDNVSQGSFSGSPSALVDGDIYSVAWDVGAKLIWFRKNALNWNNNASANPATGVGGYSTTAFPDAGYALYAQLSGAASQGTLRTEKDEFTQTTPIGFLSWMGETLVVPEIGTLPSQSSTLAGSGVVSSVGSGALAAKPVNARTNYVKYSQEIDNGAAWAFNNATVTANTAATMAPDGTQTADVFTDNATNASHYAVQSTTPSPFGTYTFSVHAKAGTNTWIQVRLSAPVIRWVNVNLVSGVIGNKSADFANPPVVVSLADGWKRISLTAEVAQGTATTYCLMLPSDINQSNPPYVGTGTTFYLWGAQLEQGTVSTAYILTTASVATAGDTLIGAGASSSIGTSALQAVSVLDTLVGTGIAQWVASGALVASVSRTNLVHYSQALDNVAAWDVSYVVMTGDVGAAPNGTTTADRMADTAPAGNRFMYTTGPPIFGSGKQATVSVYAKAETLSWFQLRCNAGIDFWANFNVATGVSGEHDVSATSLIEDVGNGWYRCSLTFVSTTTGGSTVTLIPKKTDTSGGSGFYTGDGSSLLLWGVQAELSNVPTAYIPTGASDVTVVTGASLAATGSATTPPVTGTGVLTSTNCSAVGLGVSQSFGTSVLTSLPSMRTNYLKRSQEVENFVWNAIEINIVVNDIIAPDGTLTAEKLTETITTASHRVAQTFALPVGEVYTQSIYVKADTATWLQLYSSAAGGSLYGNFNIATGVIGQASPGVTHNITPVGDGWYRCALTLPVSTASSPGFYFVIKDGDFAVGSNVGTGRSLYLWGGQVDSGSVATAYIPTLASSFSVQEVLKGTGISQVVATGALAASASFLTAAGISGLVGTGALNSQASAQVGVGTSQSSSTSATLASFPSTLVGTLSMTGTGALVADASLLSGVGVSRSVSTQGILTSFNAAIVAPGLVTALGTGILPRVGTTTSTLAGAGVVASVGTAALADQPAVIVSTGATRWIAVGTLPAGVSSIVSTGLVRWAATGALNVGASTAAGAGISRSVSTSATLLASVAAVNGLEGITNITGTGTLPAQSHTLAGAGVSRSLGTGALSLTGAALAGAGLSGSLGTPSLLSQASVISAPGKSSSTGVGALASTVSSVAAFEGINVVAGTGSITASSSSGFGAGIVGWAGTGTLTTVSTISASGVSGTSGVASLLSSLSNVEGSGAAVDVVYGTGTPKAQSSTASGIGESSVSGAAVLDSQPATTIGSGFVRLSGGGLLLAELATATGVGIVQSRGPGVVISGKSVVIGSGVSTFIMAGALVARAPRLFGYGFSQATGASILQDNISTVVGTGTVRWTATGALHPERAAIVSVALSGSFGTGVLFTTRSTVIGWEVYLTEGAGTLVSGQSTVTGDGWTSDVSYLVPPDPPGSYPGTSLWVNPGVAPWVNPGTGSPAVPPPAWWTNKAA